MIKETLEKRMHKLAGIQKEYEDDLFAKPNVIGVSIGNKIKKGVESEDPVISVLVTHKVTDGLSDREMVTPKDVKEKAKTDVVEIGDIFAGGIDDPADLGIGDPVDLLEEQDTEIIQIGSSPSLTRKMRPAMGGFSVGHYRVTAGTLGTGCYDLFPFPGIPMKFYILSNNHVLANSNQCRIGDPILQPGRIDGGKYPRDVIAKLSRYVPIRFVSGSSRPCNYVDAAIAEGNLQDINRQVYWGGHIKRLYTAPKLGDIVQKTGRTTGLTTGRVTNINATVLVNYGGGRVAKFCRQIITTAMSLGGDSGSLVTNLDEGAVGLLFAGSANRTIVNNIYFVQRFLRIRVTEK